MFVAASLAAILLVFWLLLSGHYTLFLVASGVATAAIVGWIAWMVGFADEEGHPIEMLPRGLLYWPWLIAQVIKSAFAVSWIIVHPALPISPRLVRVKTSQRRPVGLVTYANSITLTPGTVTVEVHRQEHELTVHALTKASADGLETGEMDRRVTAMEGGRS